VLDEVEGYPFFIQLWGAELWEAAADAKESVLSVELLDAIEPAIYRRLDEEFHAGRLETLTPAEQDLLLSTAACPYPPLTTLDIRSRSDKSGGPVPVHRTEVPRVSRSQGRGVAAIRNVTRPITASG
jgi:hypothetical protein